MNTSRQMSSPQMIVSYISAMFGLMTFTSSFFTVDRDTMLAMGLIRLILGSLLFIAALINIFKGIPDGNLNLIVAVCFGLLMGTNAVIDSMGEGVGILQLIPCGIKLFGGAYMLLLLPALLGRRVYSWISQTCAGAGLVMQAIAGIFEWQWLFYLSGILFLAYGLISIYGGLSAIIPSLKQGPAMEELIGKHKSRQAD